MGWMKARGTRVCSSTGTITYMFVSTYIWIEGAFSAIAPKIWNNLPLSSRSQNELSHFKNVLKAYFL